MNLQHRVFLPPLARLVLGLRRMKHSGPQPERCAFDAALTRYTRQDYAGAFDALARLADDGHPPASRIALLMVEHGTRLFGHRFVASAASRRLWQAVADSAGEAT
jgi:hypothetical protein